MQIRPPEPSDAVARTLSGGISELADAIHALAIARIRSEDGGRELLRLAALLQAVLIGSNLMGRLRTIVDARHAHKPAAVRVAFAKDPLPDWVRPLGRPVPFRQAIDDLLSREGILENDYLELARRYSTEHVFGMARSADMVITERVRDILRSAFATTKDAPAAVEEAIARAGDFSRSYAETVFRTSAATDYTEGRLEKAKEPHIAAVIPALGITGPHDDDTRKNHWACDMDNRATGGVVAAASDPIWRVYKTPLGYNCRHRTDYLSREDCKDRGILLPDGTVRRASPPRGGYPDPGFRP